MKKLFSLISLVFCLPISAQTEQEKLESLLQSLPDVSFQKISKPNDAYLKYNLTVQQAVNHKSPKSKQFLQTVILTHKGFDKPTVMETQGYTLENADNEIALLLNANNLNIEHRFYGKSVPDSLQWDCLNFEQEAADLHHINELFRKIYPNKYISTGISAGGVQTILYNYFYPADLDAAVPYVAPINNGLEDKRIYDFLDTVGSAECRKKIADFQIFLLQHETEAIDKVKWFCLARHLTFTNVESIGKAFEYAVLEYSFAFWQYGNTTCVDIPTNNSVDAYLEHLLAVSDISFYSDRAIKSLEPHYYQVATENGYYGYKIAPFKSYLHFLPTTQNPSAIFCTPRTAKHKPYNGSLFQKVTMWVNQNANNMIYIYGGADPWAACRVVISSKVNSKIFLLPHAAHEASKIKNMSPDMKKSVADLLAKFSGSAVNLDALK